MADHTQTNILTITLHPALDYASGVPQILPNQKLYCGPARIDPGGGGVNVARAIGKLGGQATAFVVSGGPTGDRLLRLLAEEGATHVLPFPVVGETRFSFAVTDGQSGDQLRFSLPGEALSATERTNLLAAIEQAAPQDGLVVLSGGVAPGLPDDIPQRIQTILTPKAARLVVDTSKAPLRNLIESPIAPLFLLRVDRKEAARAAQHAMDTLEDSLTFARSLVARGVAQHVVTGRGPDGSLMVTQSDAYFCRAPQVPVVSRVGAGDALVGALTLSFARGDPPARALRWGVAAASATVGTEGTALCELETTMRLFRDCIVEKL